MVTMQGVNLPTLKKGDRRQEVKLLQTLLNQVGYSVGKVDGIFGSKTENAVIQFTNYKSKTVTIDVWYNLMNKL